MRNLLLISLFSISWLNHYGQYSPLNNIPVMHGANELVSGFAGGLNAGQFSHIDLNDDGKLDLFIYDRGSKTFITLLNEGGGVFTYAPQYEAIFPKMEDWAVLRDFNCDGIPDIFTYYIGSTKPYIGKIVDGNLVYEEFKERITYYDEGSETYVGIYTARTDIPSFEDIDFDGDMDILSFSVSSTTIRYYKNLSMESGYGCDSLNYDLVEYCWGEIYEGVVCSGAELGVICKGGADETMQREMHSGSTSLTFDKDGDHDIDLVLGDNSCNNLVYYKNGGDSSYAAMVSKDTIFPSNTVSYEAPVFPVAFLIDADDDGDEDLVATTNDDLLGQNREHIWLYENLNTNDTFDFVFLSDSFIIGDMIDIGSYSKPTYFDYNSDGLLDIVIGIGSSYGRDVIFRYGLWLYKNIGTADAPSFEFITDDFAGLALYNESHLAPFFADADNDGDGDLFCGSFDGTIIYVENLAGPGAEASFDVPEFYYNEIDVGQLSAPCLIDIDEDGKLDMVIGEMNGNLNYFYNTGTASAPAFELESEIWGGVDVRETGYVTGYSVPYMYRNENDSLYLIVASQSGRIFVFNEIEDALLGEFYEADTNALGYAFGTYASAMLGDINNNGKSDYLTGNIRGGIQLLEKTFADDIVDHTNDLDFHIFPNPASDQIVLQLNSPPSQEYIIHLYNPAGQLIRTVTTAGEHVTLSLTGLAVGIYAVEVVSGEARQAVKVVVMK